MQQEAERDFIRSNLSALIDLTDCNTRFLAYCHQEIILSGEDVQRINAFPVNYDKAAEFYQIIQMKTGAFLVLLHALGHAEQTGALGVICGIQMGRIWNGGAATSTDLGDEAGMAFLNGLLALVAGILAVATAATMISRVSAALEAFVLLHPFISAVLGAIIFILCIPLLLNFFVWWYEILKKADKRVQRSLRLTLNNQPHIQLGKSVIAAFSGGLIGGAAIGILLLCNSTITRTTSVGWFCTTIEDKITFPTIFEVTAATATLALAIFFLVCLGGILAIVGLEFEVWWWRKFYNAWEKVRRTFGWDLITRV